MRRRNLFVRSLRALARKFRALQEKWILPWWGSGGLASAPLWALDTVVLVVKLCSAVIGAAVRVLIPPTPKSLHGETVLITGAGSGVGRELALQFSELGATVICWDNDQRRMSAIVEEIRNKDGECYGYTVDVTVRDQVISLATRMRRQLTEISMIVSNAGALTCGPLHHLHPELVMKLLDLNFLAHFWIIQAFLPSMIERRYGHIIAINSSAGLMPFADMVPYCAAKFGLRGLMDSLTEELRLDTWTKNIYTTSVYLATVSTGFYPPPSHRFTSWYSEITPKEAAKIIIDGIRKNHKSISIPSFMSTLIDLNNLMPYRIRIIFTDFFNFGHRGDDTIILRQGDKFGLRFRPNFRKNDSTSIGLIARFILDVIEDNTVYVQDSSRIADRRFSRKFIRLYPSYFCPLASGIYVRHLKRAIVKKKLLVFTTSFLGFLGFRSKYKGPL